MDEAVAFAKQGGTIDLTSFVPGPAGMPKAIKASRALRQALEAEVPLERITMSTDGNGVHPFFGPDGAIERLELWEIGTLYEEMRDLVRDEGLPLEDAIRPVTVNVARLLRLDDHKGQIRVGSDADLVLLDPELRIAEVYARGRRMLLCGPRGCHCSGRSACRSRLAATGTTG